ncbi:MAG: hypothetical protein V4812_21610 [Pseudomonadota bacterium]
MFKAGSQHNGKLLPALDDLRKAPLDNRLPLCLKPRLFLGRDTVAPSPIETFSWTRIS